MKRKLIALILSAALILTLSGCGTDTRYAMTVKGEEVPAGVYIISQYYAASMAQNKFAEEYPDEDMWADGWKPDDYQLEGMKYTEWVNQKALELTARAYVVENMFKERGLSFTREESAEINSSIEARWDTDKQMEELYAMLGEQALQFGEMGGETWGQFFEKAGVSKESFKFMHFNDEKIAAIFANIYGPEGTESVPEEEWLPLFEEGYLRVKMVSMTKVDDEGEPLPQEQIDDLKEVGLEQFKFIEDGGYFYLARQSIYEYLYNIENDDNVYDMDIDDLYDDEDLDSDENADENDEEDNVESDEEDDVDSEEESETDEEDEEDEEDSDLEDENTEEDTGTQDDQEEFDYISEMEKQLEEYIKIADFPENEVVLKLLEMDFDIPEFFETETANYIMVKLDVLEREDVYPEYRDDIIIDLKAEGYDDMLNQNAKDWIQTGSVTVNQKAIDRYDPKRFIKS